MTKGKVAEKPVDENMENAREAVDTYFDYLQNTWGHIRKMRTYTAIECVKKLSEPKNFQDAARIQTEFMQTQWHSFGEQAKSLGETYIKKQRLQ